MVTIRFLSAWLCLVLALTLFAVSVLLYPTRTIKPALVETAATTHVRVRADEPPLDLHYCRVNKSNAPERPYLCAGPAYENFTDRMNDYALLRRQDENQTLWGRRSFPLPANKTVFMLGNSHTRQVYNTLLCEYNSMIYQSEDHGEFVGGKYTTFGSSRSWYFRNNATLITLSNSPLVYSKKQWVSTFEKLFQRSFASFDAIIMGRFNRFENRSRYGREIIKYSKAHPELFDRDYSSPTIESLAEMYQGPILAVPMFAPHGQDVMESAERAQKENPGRDNIKIVDARKHIEVLGECGSDDMHGIGVCLEAGDKSVSRDPTEMHRCTGEKGGHPDLVAWDIVEELHHILA